MPSSRPQVNPEYLDLRALAEYTCIGLRTWRAILKGPDSPPVIKLKGKHLVSKRDVDNWLEAKKVKAADPVGEAVEAVLAGLPRVGPQRPRNRGRG